jgi:hypothetical protein
MPRITIISERNGELDFIAYVKGEDKEEPGSQGNTRDESIGSLIVDLCLDDRMPIVIEDLIRLG